MAKQSAVDIRFQDVAAYKLETDIGKTLEKFTKDLLGVASRALGAAGGSPSNLGVLTNRKDDITGIRLGVDAAYAERVSAAINSKLSRMAEALGIGNIAQASVSDRPIFKDVSAQVWDAAGLQNLQDYLGGVGGKILRSYPTARDGHTTYRVRVPDVRYAGTPADTTGMIAGIGEASHARMLEAVSDFNALYKGTVLPQIEQQRKADERRKQETLSKIAYGKELTNRNLTDADWSAVGAEGFDWEAAEEAEDKKRAAAAEAMRKPDSGYISGEDRYFEDKEERRRKLGIVTEDSKDVASEQEKKSFFGATALKLTALVTAVQKIASMVWKLVEQSIQTRYASMTYGVNSDVLLSFQNALEGSKLDRNAANKAIGAVTGGLINPYTLNTSLVAQLAPIMGGNVSDVVTQMLSNSADPMAALRDIMEAARSGVSSGKWSLARMLNQLGPNFADSFLGYYNWYNKNETNRLKGFNDYIGYIPAKYVDETAETGLGLQEFWTKIKNMGANEVRELISGSAWKGVKGIYNRLGLDPEKVNPADLYESLKSGEYNKYYRTGYGSNFMQQIEKDLKELRDAAQSLGLNTSFLTPVPDTSSSLVENLAYGFGGAGTSFGGTVYNEIDNSVNTSTAAGGGSMDISLNISGGGKNLGRYPLEMGTNNMININYWG